MPVHQKIKCWISSTQQSCLKHSGGPEEPEVNNEPSRLWISNTNGINWPAPRLARCCWSAVHTGLGSMAKQELTIDPNHPQVSFISPLHTSTEINKKAVTIQAEVNQQHVQLHSPCDLVRVSCAHILPTGLPQTKWYFRKPLHFKWSFYIFE